MGYSAKEFRTLDGTVLRGRLYAAPRLGPAVVMCPGVSSSVQRLHERTLTSRKFNCVMDMVGMPDVAELFQKAGISVLQFDPRNTGTSDGTPRNEIDPMKQVEDLSDALTFLGTQPEADATNLGLWGFSFGGTVSLCAAALDKRAKFVVAVCPLSDLDFEPGKQLKVLARAIKDRESQLLGNAPFSIPVLNANGENPVGFGHGIDKERYAKLIHAGHQLAPNHVNRVTLQTYYKMVMWQPFPLWLLLSPVQVMFVTGELDQMSYPELQKSRFEELSCTKRIYLRETAGHEDIMSGEHLIPVVHAQIQFIGDVFAGTVQ
jgi:pimeloyl-ACP methyl ester carboxylesterase